MALKFPNLVRESVTTTGTGTITLSGTAFRGCRSFATALAAGDIADGDTIYYRIEDGLNWEVGIGTYASAGTLARTTCHNSSAGGTTKITLSGGASVWADVAGAWFAGIATASTVVDAGGDTTCWILMVGTQTGTLVPLTDGGITYNANTNALTATTFVGALTGNASTASAVAVGGITGLGTSVATALAVNVGSAGAFVVNGGELGTPSSGTLTNCSGLTQANGATGIDTSAATGVVQYTAGSAAIAYRKGFYVSTQWQSNGTTDATLANVTYDGSNNIEWALSAGKKYKITLDLRVQIQTGATVYGIALTSDGTLTATTFLLKLEDQYNLAIEVINDSSYTPKATTSLGTAVSPTYTQIGSTVDIRLVGTIHVNVAGTLRLQAASDTNTKWVRVNTRSVAICEEIL